MPPFWTPQNADAFNQLLSFNTSSVTNMGAMFRVRFRLRVLPTHPSWASRTPRALLIQPSLCVPSPLCHTHSLCRLPLLLGLGRMRMLSISC